jgi:hypothetical protein
MIHIYYTLDCFEKQFFLHYHQKYHRVQLLLHIAAI